MYVSLCFKFAKVINDTWMVEKVLEELPLNFPEALDFRKALPPVPYKLFAQTWLVKLMEISIKYNKSDLNQCIYYSKDKKIHTHLKIIWDSIQAKLYCIIIKLIMKLYLQNNLLG